MSKWNRWGSIRNQSRLAYYLFIAFALSLGAPLSEARSISMIVVGEDSDTSALKRNSETFKRVTSELQQTLISRNVNVIDIDMVAAKIGLTQRVGLDRQTIFEILSKSNQSEDASVKSRFAFIFSVVPNIQEMSATRRISVRIRGQIFDLKNSRALPAFDITSKNPVSVPRDAGLCNELCIQEKVGDLAVATTSDLANNLYSRFQEVISQESRSMSTQSNQYTDSIQKNDHLVNTYTIRLTRLDVAAIRKLIDRIGAKYNYEIDLVSAKENERVYSIRSPLTLLELERLMLREAAAVGIRSERLSITAKDF